MKTIPSLYRPCVGIVLFNKDGLIFLGKRNDVSQNSWQMPQGGIDNNERRGGKDVKANDGRRPSQVCEGTYIPLLSLPRYLKVSPNNPIISEPYIFPTNEDFV